MASIYQRDNKDGTKVWRAVVRRKGYPSVCEHFNRKQEAEDWAADVERKIKMGQFQLEQHKGQKTFVDLVEQYLNSGALEHLKAADDTIRHLNYWKKRFKAYELVHLTPELVSKERKLLLSTPTYRNQQRSPSTVNRYMASLSAVLTYASRELRWVNDNPCLKLRKLKEPLGRERVLTEEEAICLLKACSESKSPYLYCIVLIALTTGMRRGEILGLTWSCIDFENSIALLRDTKNGRPRHVPLIPEVMKKLKELYSKRNPMKPLVFASHTAFGKIDFKKSWNEALNRAGLAGSGLVFHSTRHTFITFSSRQKTSTLELAAASGHLCLSSLMHYNHTEAEMTRKFGEEISKRILKADQHD